jgi:hypothetical protein
VRGKKVAALVLLICFLAHQVEIDANLQIDASMNHRALPEPDDRL